MLLAKFLSSIVILTAIIPVEAVALIRPEEQVQSPSRQLISVEFPSSAPNTDNPQDTAGGGIRGTTDSACVASNITPLTALIPKNSEVTTLSNNPSLLIYIPETTASSAEFTLRDIEGNDLYEKRFSLPQNSGIVKVSLPKNLALESNTSYNWAFSLICDPSDPSVDAYVFGKLKRTTLTSEQEKRLQQVSQPLEKAEIYSKFHIWSETLETVTKLRETDPSEWEELLKSVGIEDKKIIEAPLLEKL